MQIVHGTSIKVKPFFADQGFALHAEADLGQISGGCILVCTPEKAVNLFDQLSRLKQLRTLALCVVDELHFLGDKLRGHVYEELLSKIVFFNRRQCDPLRLDPVVKQSKIQIIAMSATIPNLSDLGNWLGANIFFGGKRPIPLQHFLIFGEKIYKDEVRFYLFWFICVIFLFVEEYVLHLFTSQIPPQVVAPNPNQLAAIEDVCVLSIFVYYFHPILDLDFLRVLFFFS
jgi:hypothetical protein